MKYRKSDMEIIILTQLENLNALGEHIRLIKEQNSLLLKYNHKLIEQLSDKDKEPKPYPITKKKNHEK